MTNSVDPDETAHEPSHLDLHCMQRCIFSSSGLKVFLLINIFILDISSANFGKFQLFYEFIIQTQQPLFLFIFTAYSPNRFLNKM